MQTLPFSIYIDKRPLRIAFLANPNKTVPQQLDAIFEYNQGKWGGRFNPIIFTNGKTIEEKWWKFLRDFDPDVIKSLVPLQHMLLGKIENFLSPYSVEVPNKVNGKRIRHSIHISDEGLSILPTADNITRASRHLGGNWKLVLFELDQTKDETVKQFIKRNFGTYTRSLYTDRLLNMNQKKLFPITDRESLAAALSELSTFEQYAYPIQICSLPNTFRDVEHDIAGEVFTVVVGDSPEDIVYAWNRNLIVTKWKRNDLNQIWLPTELANDTRIENALKGWLKRVADPSVNPEIRFVSFSRKKTELEQIAARLTKDVWFYKTVSIFTEPQIPKFESRTTHLRLKQGAELYRVTGNDVQITLNEPDVLEGLIGGEHWMADVFIQYRPERYKSYIGGIDLWWQLPRRNNLARRMFHKPSRICSDGFPSVLMKRGNLTLGITLPDDISIFRTLIIGENTPVYRADPRNKIVRSLFDYAKPSDKGRYLFGFLDLFSELPFAYQTLKERYWRRMFDILSHQNPKKHKEQQITVLNKLRKKMKSFGGDFRRTEDGLKWLSSYVLQLLKEQTVSGKEVLFRSFVEEAKKELEEFKSSRQNGQKFKFNKQAVKDALFDLVESNILLMGFRLHCPSCGYANWYHLDEARQILQCKGCGHKYPMLPEVDWYYKLNSLVQAGCSQHGLTPVVLVLGQLFYRSKSSFMMAPSLDLFRKRRRQPIGDLDIVCIQDGRFIIGEIKQSIDLFKKSNFEKMAEIAELLKPNTLIFSSLDPEPNRLVKNNLKILKDRLAPLEIEVCWYPLDSYIFEASPVQ